MGCSSRRIRIWPSPGLIPRLFLQGDIIVSGQRAEDSFLAPVAAMVTLRRGSSLHNPAVLSILGLVTGDFDL